MLKKIWKISSLKYIAAFLIPLLFVFFMNQALDNDSWYVIAEGREIVNNGIYYTDQLSMHEGLSVTVQNYGFSVLFYLIYSVMGAPAIYAVMLILNFAVCFIIYKICMLISDKNTNLSLLIMMITDIILALGFVVTRAQMISYVIFLMLIWILELYIKTDKTKYLWFIPALSLLQINLHASLWWMLVLAMLVYIIDSIKKPKLHLQGYRTKPLLIASLGLFLFGLINPYGIEMITFIFKSYGDVRFQNLIVELRSFSPFRDIFSAFLYISIVLVLTFYIFGEKKNVRVRYLLMFFGFLALGLNTVKGMSQFILVMFFPLALVYKNIKIEKVIDAKVGRDAVMFWIGAIAFVSFAIACPIVVGQIDNRPDDVLVGALDAIEADAEGEDPKDIKIYTGYNDGGYVEYKGYKPYLDPRGEVFLKKNNKKEDILYEWIDLKDGKIKVSDFLSKYNFDYLLVEDADDSLYNLDEKGYKIIFENEQRGMRVFKNISYR